MTDGRHARRDRNREAVIDAATALIVEGVVRPRLEAVAARSGVSLRSVHRYFADRHALYLAVIERNMQEHVPHLLIEGVGEGPASERIGRFVDVRLGFYDRVAPLVRGARVVAHDDELVRGRLDLLRAVLREQVERQFAPELATREGGVADAIDALTQLEALEHLRHHRGLDPEAAGDVLRAGIAALLAGEAP